MASTMPIIPRVLFQFLEPMSLLLGLVVAWSDPDTFINKQYVTPGSSLAAALVPNSINAKLIAYQLGNMYALVGMIGVGVFTFSSEPKVIKSFIFACLVGDVGHIVPTVLMMGWDKALDIANWNDMAWGNIGITVILFTLRSMYLLGAFGEHRAPVVASKKRV